MKDVEINIKVLKNRVFFSIPLDVWDPGSMTSINGYILNGNLIIPLYSEIIGFSDDELTLLRKLSSIKFNQRRVRDILRSLTPKEKKTMDKLIARGVVTVYKRAGGAVYSISDVVYPLLYKKKDENSKGNVEKIDTKLPDYLVISTEEELSKINEKYENEIKKGMLFGTRDFKDKNYYVVSKPFYDKYHPLILSLLRKEAKDVEEIAQMLRINPLACKGILLIMNERGEIYQKDGKYHAVE